MNPIIFDFTKREVVVVNDAASRLRWAAIIAAQTAPSGDKR